MHQLPGARPGAPLRLSPGEGDDDLRRQLCRRHVAIHAQARQVRRPILARRLLRHGTFTPPHVRRGDHTYARDHFTDLLDFVRDYPGEQLI